LSKFDYDIVIYDNIGSPIDPKWAAEQPVGGTEYGMTQLAVGMSRRGYRVLTVSNLPEAWGYSTTDGPHCISVKKGPVVTSNWVALTCKVIVCSRFSTPWLTTPQIKPEKTVIAAMDVYCDYYAKTEEMIAASQAEPAVVLVSQWQAALFPSCWKKIIIPAMIDDEVYSLTSVPKNPKAFVYASSSIKGLHATLEVWATIKGKLRGTPYEDIVLHVTGPGYGDVDPDLVRAAGAEWVGHKSTGDMQHFIAEHAGLFFVNTFPECFCAVAAVAEAAGCRTHILCKHEDNGLGALPQTINSPLLTNDEELFIQTFIRELYNPTVESCPPKDFRRSAVLNAWEHALFGTVSSTEEIADRRGRLLAREQFGEAPTVPDRVTLPPAKCLTIGLIMIAKDEAHVLPRSLGSVKHLFDYYTIILDADNTDNSEEVIKQVLGDIPGQVLKEPYMNVSYARNRAIFHAEKHTDYLFALDADDVVEGFIDKSELGADSYDIRIIDGSALTSGGAVPVNMADRGCCVYMRPVMIRSGRGFRYVGVDHEYLTSDVPNTTRGLIQGAVMRRYTDGRSWVTPEIEDLRARTNAGKVTPEEFAVIYARLTDEACRQKYYKRAKLLERELEKNPADSRSAYYCAQNYFDARCKHEAAQMYLKRASMGGWDQEVFMALMRAADILADSDKLNIGAISWEKLYLQACEVCPFRATEALWHLAWQHFQQKNYMKAYIYAKATFGTNVPESNMPVLLIDEQVYAWKAPLLYGWSAFNAGFKKEAKAMLELILPNLPAHEETQVRELLEQCK
jgi:hypothetical protein